MSLINQMLRDLQSQKGQAPKNRKSLKPKPMERIPYLPLPLILAGAGLALIVMIWWLAGVLSDALFSFEPTEKTAGQVASEQPPAEQTLEQQGEAALPVPDQLTPQERHAEPSDSSDVAPPKPKDAVTQRPVSANEKTKTAVIERRADKVVSANEKPKDTVTERPAGKVVSANEKTKPVAKKVVAPGKPVVRKTSPAVKKAAPKVVSTAKTTPTPVPETRKTVRLHPDELPGAVRSAAPVKVAPSELISRPGRVQATSPYGRAEEAYLDGLWALEKQRQQLAIRSLQYALDVYPGHLKARTLLTSLLEESGQSAEAILVLTEGLEIAPDYADFKKDYASLMVKQGDYDAATKALLKDGLPDIQQDPETHTILASLYQKLDEPFLAAQTYRNLLVVWPETGAFWVGLGSALEAQNLKSDAIECYQQALEKDKLRDDLRRFAKRRLNLLN